MTLHASKPRPRCAFRLDYLGRHYCRESWRREMMSEAKEIPYGCPINCEEYKAAFPTEYDEPSVEKPKAGG